MNLWFMQCGNERERTVWQEWCFGALTFTRMLFDCHPLHFLSEFDVPQTFLQWFYFKPSTPFWTFTRAKGSLISIALASATSKQTNGGSAGLDGKIMFQHVNKSWSMGWNFFDLVTCFSFLSIYRAVSNVRVVSLSRNLVCIRWS